MRIVLNGAAYSAIIEKSMTKKQIVSKFLRWVGKNSQLKAEVENLDAGSKTCESKVFRIVEYTQMGTPWTTVCFEVLPPKTSETDGWYEVIKRKCAGTLTVDQFSEIGVGSCGSIEEFILKLEISG